MQITTIECKLGIIHPQIHSEKFNEREFDFISRCRPSTPIAKLAERLIDGTITADDFTVGCDLIHKLTNWRKGL